MTPYYRIGPEQYSVRCKTCDYAICANGPERAMDRWNAIPREVVTHESENDQAEQG